jgi:Lon protease-like protein
MSDPADGLDLRRVPLFPLPNVVLFPRAVLPLHIFEHRYRSMTADALSGGRLIAMALLKPGWEKDYHGRPEIEQVVCVGNILTHEKLPDGKYNFLLSGLARARIVAEHDSHPYRTAALEPLVEPAILEIDLAEERGRFEEVFRKPPFSQTTLAAQFQKMLVEGVPTQVLADVAAFHLLEDLHAKQKLLEELDPRARVRALIHHLSAMTPLGQLLQGDHRLN